MLMSGDVPQGSLCSTNEASALIEDLQYTLGEGPSVDAYRYNQVVHEPDLANPAVARWSAFSPLALSAGVRAVFGFPFRMGGARLGAVNPVSYTHLDVYKRQPLGGRRRHRPGP